jgi:hypothetical protein
MVLMKDVKEAPEVTGITVGDPICKITITEARLDRAFAWDTIYRDKWPRLR